MGYKFSDYDCFTALKEANFEYERAIDNVINGVYKPWKVNPNKAFGAHREAAKQHSHGGKNRLVTIQFKKEDDYNEPDDLFKDEDEPINKKIEIEIPSNPVPKKPVKVEKQEEIIIELPTKISKPEEKVEDKKPERKEVKIEVKIEKPKKPENPRPE